MGQGGDMSVFHGAVQDCRDDDVEASRRALIANKGKVKKGLHEDAAQVERFSGLRIRNQVVSPAEISSRIADIRFVRLPAIKWIYGGALGFWQFDLLNHKFTSSIQVRRMSPGCMRFTGSKLHLYAYKKPTKVSDVALGLSHHETETEPPISFSGFPPFEGNSQGLCFPPFSRPASQSMLPR